MVFKIKHILSEDIAKKFWSSLLSSDQSKASRLFNEALTQLQSKVSLIPDERSKQLISDAIDFAISNPERLFIHTNAKAIKTGHLPNLTVFPNLLDGIEHYSQQWNRPVKEIVHDRQNEMESTLRHWHELFSTAMPRTVKWFGDEYTTRKAGDSIFRISSSEDSVGIQAIDIILWLFKKVVEGSSLPLSSYNLMKHVLNRSYQNDMSFESMDSWLTDYFKKLDNSSFTDEQLKSALKYFDKLEENRLTAMQEYAIQKLTAE